MPKKRFFEKTWFLVLMILLVPPVGIALIWLLKKNWSKIMKILLSAVLAVWTVIWGAGAFSSNGETPSSEPESITECVVQTMQPPKEETTTHQEVDEKTTTEKSTTEKETTTKKVTTTAKPTTTKAPTTKETTTEKSIATTAKETTAKKVTTTEKPVTTTKKSNDPSGGVTVPNKSESQGNLVWVPVNGGTKYHRTSTCSNMKDPIQVSKETAQKNGYEPCGRCY